MIDLPVKEENIASRILFLRGQKVLLDADLAGIYGVSTKALNQAVKRNPDRFPDDFMFRLSEEEWKSLKSQIVTANRGGRRTPPYAFTEHGALMLTSIINSAQAVQASVFVVRAFIRMREMIRFNQEIFQKIEDLKSEYDEKFLLVFEAIQELVEYKSEPREAVGYKSGKME